MENEIEDQRIEFNTAILAKEIGFKWKVSASWDDRGTDDPVLSTNKKHKDYNTLCDSISLISAPTQSKLQYWLREEEKIMVWCEPVSKSNTDEVLWTVKLIDWSKTSDVIDLKLKLLYEKALEPGLVHALNLAKK